MKTKKESTMKKLIASLIIAGSAVAIPAQAQHYHHGYRWGGGSWVAPAIIGGVIGYELNRPRYDPYYYPPQQVIIQQPPVIYQQPQVIYGAPTQAPVMPMPGQVCELKSEMINGQVVTGNFCYQK